LRPARLFELGQQSLHLVDRYGEADVLRVGTILGTPGYCRVHADDLPSRVDEGTTGVARIDGGIGLDQVLEFSVAVPVPPRSPIGQAETMPW